MLHFPQLYVLTISLSSAKALIFTSILRHLRWSTTYDPLDTVIVLLSTWICDIQMLSGRNSFSKVSWKLYTFCIVKGMKNRTTVDYFQQKKSTRQKLVGHIIHYILLKKTIIFHKINMPDEMTIRLLSFITRNMKMLNISFKVFHHS